MRNTGTTSSASDRGASSGSGGRTGSGAAGGSRSGRGARPLVRGDGLFDLRDKLSGWNDRARQEIHSHPGRSTAIALGVGYVVGGGLFSSLTARLLGVGLRVGLRVALIPFVTRGLATLGESLLSGEAGADDKDGAAEEVQVRQGNSNNTSAGDAQS
jgi:hypothetical protein